MPHLIPVDQPTLPGTQPTDAELMEMLLCAIAERDRFKAFDVIDRMFDPNDLPCRQELYKTRLELIDATR